MNRRIASLKCVYCGRGQGTRDHIPGAQWFPKPRPNNLVTVPACLQCNVSLQTHESYTLSILCLGDGGISDAGVRLWEDRIPRSLEKDRGLRSVVARSLEMIPVRSAEGLHLPPRLAVKLDWKRLRLVTDKWIRGFYFHEYRRPLPTTYFTYANLVWEANHAMFKDWLPYLMPGRSAWPGTFDYLFNGLVGTDRSIWAFRLMNSYVFLGMTSERQTPKGPPPAEAESGR